VRSIKQDRTVEAQFRRKFLRSGAPGDKKSVKNKSFKPEGCKKAEKTEDEGGGGGWGGDGQRKEGCSEKRKVGGSRYTSSLCHCSDVRGRRRGGGKGRRTELLECLGRSASSGVSRKKSFEYEDLEKKRYETKF